MNRRLVILMVFWGLSTQVCSQTIEVFYTSEAMENANANYDSVPRGWQVTYYDLAQAERLQNGISSAIPNLDNDSGRAQVVAQAWLNSEIGQTYIQDLKTAFSGYTKAVTYGINRLPAIIVNGEYLFYGVQSLREAVDALPR